MDKGLLLESLGSASEDGSEAVATQVTSLVGGRGLLTVGDSNGRLHLFDRRMSPKILSVFSGMPVKCVARASKSGLIVCVSGNANDSLVKVFDMDKLDKTTGLPSLVIELNIIWNLG